MVDANTKEKVISRVADFMRDYYVFPEIGAKMGEFIKTKHENGDYAPYADLEKFCDQVTADLREICQDRHIFVFNSPGEAREVAARNGLLPADEIEKIKNELFETDRKSNFGFNKIEILQGNVGYLDLRAFMNTACAGETAVGAMKFLSHADAIIIDLRNNGGGGEGMVELLASYFFSSEIVHLNSVYYRPADKTNQSWTLPYVPGKRMPDVDLYILTSSRTFSAAEDFAYAMKQLKRCTIVGETTKGGGHPVDVMIVEGSILTQISIGNSVNPITKTNWEGVGVEPDIQTPAEQALCVAHLLALKNLLIKTSDDPVKRELTSWITQLEVNSCQTLNGN